MIRHLDDDKLDCLLSVQSEYPLESTKLSLQQKEKKINFYAFHELAKSNK